MRDDEREIRELVASWMTLTRQGDLEGVLGLMAEDAVFLAPGQPPMTKAGFAAAAQAAAGATAPTISGTSEIEELEVLGDWAFLRTRLSVVITPPDGGPTRTRAGYTLSILKRERGRWVLARDANLLGPAVDSSA